MRLTRDYYEILGITPEATPGEIKKSYRSLVRKYHPDVHPDKKLAERAFVQISEAYRTLSDPDKKRAYDRERATRTDARPGPGVSEVFTSRSGSTTTSARPKPNVTKFINDAEFAFIRGRLGEAEALCRRALQQDRTCARAYTILGDIYHAHGNKDKAIENYSYAVQFDPHRMDVQAKLERLLGGAPRRVRSARHGSVREPVPPGARLGSIATGMMFFLVFFWLMGLQNHFSAIVPMEGLPPALRGWDLSISLGLIAEGLLLGGLLRSVHALGHHSDELVFQSMSKGTSRRRAAPIGLLLVGLSAIFFWLALAVYLLMASLQETVSKSLVTAFTIVLVYVLVLAAISDDFRLGILAVGGNFVFVSLLVGWWLTDVLRENWTR